MVSDFVLSFDPKVRVNDYTLMTDHCSILHVMKAIYYDLPKVQLFVP